MAGDSDNKISSLTQECERLNAVIEKRNNEIRNLGGEVQDYQEKIRLSSLQYSKLGTELDGYKHRVSTFEN